MPVDEFHDLIIVGGGPCGLAAGLYAMRAALDAVLLEKTLIGGQVAIPKGIENYPGIEEITGFDLVDKMLQHALSYGLKVVQEGATAIEPGNGAHSVRLANGRTLQAYAVIVATGGKARRLGIPGEVEYMGRGVSYCATCDGFFFRDKVVAVIGGGDSAVEEALYLARLARKVYIVHRRDSFRASKLLQQKVLQDPRIEVLWNTVATEIKGDDGGVAGLSLRNTASGRPVDLSVDGVFIYVGFNPDKEVVPPGINIAPSGYVVTDEKCETNIPGIFVAGDLRLKYANQIVIAASDGCVAALAAARYIESIRS